MPISVVYHKNRMPFLFRLKFMYMQVVLESLKKPYINITLTVLPVECYKYALYGKIFTSL